MNKITIKFIPHKDQRYDTVGDYWFDADGNWHITVSDMGDWRNMVLVALHEMTEMALVKHRNIPEPAICEFDQHGVRPEYEDDPGCDPRAPYHKEHMFADAIERLTSQQLDIVWDEHGDECMRVSATWPK